MSRTWRLGSVRQAMSSKSNDEIGGLRSLGQAGVRMAYEKPSLEILEAFPNRFPGRDYIINFSFPEFTSLCPVTGQPDFGEIRLFYIPDRLCVESKSFKLYMFAFRNHQSFMETITNTILEDLNALLQPRWLRVSGLFAPRGGARIHVHAEIFGPLPENDLARVKNAVRDWRMERGSGNF